MPTIREIELAEVLPQLPNITPFERIKDLPAQQADLYICALGFEDRCTAIPEWIAEENSFQCQLGVYLEYETNVEDNAVNLPALRTAFDGFCSDVTSLPCDEQDFTERLRRLLQNMCGAVEQPWVLFDISVCSAKSILLVMKVLLEFEIRLTVLYAEAAEYFPTQSEFEATQKRRKRHVGLSTGVRSIIPSAEHPGNRMDALPDLVVAYPTFKPERTRAVLAEIDESLLTEGGNALVWIVGRPRRRQDEWRIEAAKRVNGITADTRAYEASSFDYKESMAVLSRICAEREDRSHITLMPLGSKLQCLGAALYWEITRSISIMFAVPMSYNATRYTRGCSSRWFLDFGPVPSLRALLDSVGKIEVVYERQSSADVG